MGLVDEFLPSATGAVLILLFVVGVGYFTAASSADEPLDTGEVERIVVEGTNAERAKRGLGALERNATLREAARRHAEDMARRDYVAHESPDGEEAFERYGWCAGDGGYFGENVANTWYDRNVVYREVEPPVVHLSNEREVAEHIVRLWMDSEGHRETLLNDDWERVGVGVAVGENNEVFVAQAFCSGPLAASADG